MKSKFQKSFQFGNRSERSSPHISSFLIFFFTSNKNFIHTLTSKSWGEGDGTKRRLYSSLLLFFFFVIFQYNPQLITHFIHFFFKYHRDLVKSLMTKSVICDLGFLFSSSSSFREITDCSKKEPGYGTQWYMQYIVLIHKIDQIILINSQS